MRWRRLEWVVGVLILLLAVQAHAQTNTLRVIDSYGEPTDVVPVPIWLDNGSEVAGVTFRIRFDPTYITVLSVDTAGTRASGVFTHFPTQIDNVGGVVIWNGINFYDPYNNFLAPGSGPVAYVRFMVDASAPIGTDTEIRFEDGDGYVNSLSDRWGVLIVPTLEDGTFSVSGAAPNYPPQIRPVRDTTLYEGETVSFPVTAEDPEGDSLTLRGENLPANSTFPTVRGDSIVTSVFSFSPSFLQSGTYVVRFIAEDDSGGADTANSTIQVIELPNNLPIFLPISGGNVQTVSEGDTLSFDVTAHDPDGDSLDLWATNLPANASFPTVSGDSIASSFFSFAPNFDQGPDTIVVTFHARDDMGGERTEQVTVIVEDIPYSILAVDTTGGGLPGASNAIFSVNLQNADSVYGLQFDLSYDPAVITINDVTPLSRLAGFAVYDNIGDSLGTVRVVVMSYNLSSIAPGTGPILDFSCTVAPLAPPGQTPVTLSNGVEVVDIYGTTRELLLEDGFFTVDRLGDVTLNGVVDVGDVVALVAYILGDISFNSRQLAVADANLDMDINVGDVVGTINIILGRPVAPPLLDTDYLADAYLRFEPYASEPEATLVIRSEVPIAGIQAKIEYDPLQLFFSSPMATDATDGFEIESRDASGELMALMYDLSGRSIPAGESRVLKLPVDVTGDYEDDVRLLLREVVLADTLARVIPVRLQGRVGTDSYKYLSLGQNYPNPFSGVTRISYVVPSIPGSGRAMQHVTISVYNAAGRLVNTLVDEHVVPGVHSTEWDGRDESGSKVSSGIYFYNLRTEELSITKKMTVLR